MGDNVADVVVVGGGPAGSATSILLARLGYQVVLFDRAHFPRAKPCGEYMSPGVADTLRRLRLDAALDRTPPRTVPGMEIVAPNGGSMRIEYVRDGLTRTAMTMSRDMLDTRLVELAKREGVEVREGERVRGPLMREGRVAGVLASRNGDRCTLEARLTIAADGARSVLARDLGLAAAPRWPVRLGLVAHFAEDPGSPFDYGQMHVARGGYCGIAPLPHGRLNVAMVIREDAVRRSRLTATETYDRWIDTHPHLSRALRGTSRTSSVFGMGPIGSRIRRPWFPGILFVGDAAGFFDPFTGEGIFRALNGAELAAEVANRALTLNRVGAGTLRDYERLRADRFRHKEAVASLVQLFVQYPLLMRYALPRLSGRPVPYRALSGALGDISDARDFLRPAVLWSALHP